MLVLKRKEGKMDSAKIEQLQRGFLKLTEANQHFVLGLAEGVKRAQDSHVELFVGEEIPRGGELRNSAPDDGGLQKPGMAFQATT
jgi:hypothetical protein